MITLNEGMLIGHATMTMPNRNYILIVTPDVTIRINTMIQVGKEGSTNDEPVCPTGSIATNTVRLFMATPSHLTTVVLITVGKVARTIWMVQLQDRRI